MHAPRRGLRGLPRPPGEDASAPSPLPAERERPILFSSHAYLSSPTLGPRSGSPDHGDVEASFTISPSPVLSLLEPMPATDKTTSTLPNATVMADLPARQITPRALWRAPAPPLVPAAALQLLPPISTSASSPTSTASSRAPRLPAGQRLGPFGGGAVTPRRSPAPHRREDAAVEVDADRYTGEYDRLVFPRSDSANGITVVDKDDTECHEEECSIALQPSCLPHDVSRTKSVSSAISHHLAPLASECKNAPQTAAAVDDLPEISEGQQGYKPPLIPAAVALDSLPSPSSPPLLQQRQHNDAVAAPVIESQAGDWWSTLDGTISANNTLREHTSILGGSATGSHLAPQQPSFPTSLNNTLGRADRAAMVLGSSFIPLRDRSSTATAAAFGVAQGADDGRSSGKENSCGPIDGDTDEDKVTTAAVAALASRLSRAAGGSHGGGANTTMTEVSGHGSHHDTLQSLRDTLRFARSLPLGLEVAEMDEAPLAVGSAENHIHTDATPRDARERDGNPSAPFLVGIRLSRPVAEAPPLVSGPRATTKPSPQRGGSQRVHEALSRLYANHAAPGLPALMGPTPPVPIVGMPAVLLPFSEVGGDSGGVAAQPARFPAAFSTAGSPSGNGRVGSHGAVSRHAVGCGGETSEHGTGNVGAHTRNSSLAGRNSPQRSSQVRRSVATRAAGAATQDIMSPNEWQRERLTVEVMRRRYGPLGAVHSKRRRDYNSHGHYLGRKSDKTPHLATEVVQPVSPTGSSIFTADFSVASLTSSIFLRELGVHEAARRRCAKQQLLMESASGVVATANRNKNFSAATMASQAPSVSKASVGAASVQPKSLSSNTLTNTESQAYRQKQVQVYASHLVSRPSESGGALDYDVDDLFRDANLPSRGVRKNADPPTSLKGRGGIFLSGAKMVGMNGVGATPFLTTPALPSPATTSGLNALDRALQAREALLRRHVQESPAWEQQLHKVRQWCDRTHVMVRFDNGVCVEQMAAGPSHRVLAKQKREQLRKHSQSVSPSANAAAEALWGRRDGDAPEMGDGDDSTAAEAVASSPLTTTTSPAATPTFEQVLAEKRSQGGEEGEEEDKTWEHFVYDDDPETAHAAVMKVIAEEDNEVRRQNALQQCRRRRRGDASVLKELMDGCGAGRATSLDQQTRPVRSSTPVGSNDWDLPVRSFRAVGDPRSLAFPEEERAPKNSLLTISSSNGPLPMLHPSPSPYISELPSVVRLPQGRMVGAGPSRANKPALGAHMELCARFRTWGSDVDEAEDDTPSGLSSNTLLTRGGPGQVLEAASEVCSSFESGLSLSSGAARPSVDSRAPFPTNGVKRESRRTTFNSLLSTLHPMTSSSNVGTAKALTKVECDLLVFVLTCASGGSGESMALMSSSAPLRAPGVSSVVEDYEPGMMKGRRPRQDALDALYAMLVQGLDMPPCEQVIRTPPISLGNATEEGETAQRGARRTIPSAASVDQQGAAQRVHHAFPAASATTALTIVVPTPSEPVWGACGSPMSLHSPKSAEAALPLGQLQWGSLLSTFLGGYSAFDIIFLKEIHGILWRYEAWHQGVDPPPVGSTLTDKSKAHFGQQRVGRQRLAPPRVWPLLLRALTPQHMIPGPSVSDPNFDHSLCIPFVTTVDTADLLSAVSGTALLRWLNDARVQSPTSSWSELVGRMPSALALDWQVALVRCFQTAVERNTKGPALGSPLVSQPSAFSSAGWHTRPLAVTASTASEELSLISFECRTSECVEAAVWRLRVLDDVLRRVGKKAEEERAALSSEAASQLRDEMPASVPLLCVGDTPYVSADEARPVYPLDMRNLYLLSRLASEDFTAHVAPQLKGIRKAYGRTRQEALAAASAALLEAPASSHGSPPIVAKPVTSLPMALQQRVYIDRLLHVENRFLMLLSTLWNLEQSVCAFNAHVAPFNAFTTVEQERWGPLYRSSLKVAFFVCEEIAAKGMENLSPELLPFVSVVASFVGCRMGHRELLAKLKSVMLDLTERAKKVQLQLESMSWQKKRTQVLEEALRAASLAPRRAAAVVSCLTAESDAMSEPLAEVALPSLHFTELPPLLSPTARFEEEG